MIQWPLTLAVTLSYASLSLQVQRDRHLQHHLSPFLDTPSV
ncbi:protein of unknown function [Lactiplantibacillus plantarum]